VLVIAVEDVRDNRFMQRSEPVIYLPNLHIAHYLRQIMLKRGTLEPLVPEAIVLRIAIRASYMSSELSDSSLSSSNKLEYD
jgi:hypothetical protein